MDDAIPSISTVGVGSRFVSQGELEAAKSRRDEQWRAAYARHAGPGAPPQPAEDAFDGRSLAEKLAANRAAKQEEWEERNKLGIQFRALEEDEVLFLDSVLEKQREEERLRKEMDGEEIKNFREAVAARDSAANKPPPVGAASVAAPAAPAKAKPTAAPVKKDLKKSLKGVLVKKKTKTPAAPGTQPSAAAEQKPKIKPDDSSEPHEDERQTKRRKVSSS
ncbi:N-terminal domain of NEFA-interacting nuclear protein NIP30-domain-containing protein [Epithele typhae]|uniref:N-terminal domain of NEFA-interacting nuclear protein NIP30-domain-containing protein n=1 Tax=Epithele typhae TaxID=378194 RepID=UPI0020075961|nr:N-terminal domain of NEFA-interacting nuclear protein NIP30-domain-containing protein [Epithele typhae]KAH9944096.1 N-terminal domain of NEFA-interacting nuclear protein NIP30-domain-containing protein [Epithele typhae]